MYEKNRRNANESRSLEVIKVPSGLPGDRAFRVFVANLFEVMDGLVLVIQLEVDTRGFRQCLGGVSVFGVFRGDLVIQFRSFGVIPLSFICRSKAAHHRTFQLLTAREILQIIFEFLLRLGEIPLIKGDAPEEILGFRAGASALR